LLTASSSLEVEKDKIDIGGHVQLAAAELAHAHNRKLGPPAALRHPRLKKRERGIDGDFRQRGHRPAHFVEGGGARKIASHRAQEHALAQRPQRGMQRALVYAAALAQERLQSLRASSPRLSPAPALRATRARRNELPGVAGKFRAGP